MPASIDKSAFCRLGFLVCCVHACALPSGHVFHGLQTKPGKGKVQVAVIDRALRGGRVLGNPPDLRGSHCLLLLPTLVAFSCGRPGHFTWLLST